MGNELIFRDLHSMNYNECWDIQKEINNNVIENISTHHLLFVEHPHTLTLGKNGKVSNLLVNKDLLEKKGVEFVHTDRGGDITYHGPGQIVGYPIFNLHKLNIGIKEYVSNIETVIINLMNLYNIKTQRIHDATGVWIDDNNLIKRKICAIGVKVSKGVTMHGFALNVNTDLSYFNMINPCGFVDKTATSMQKELNQVIDIEDVKEKLLIEIVKVFNLNSKWQK